MSVTLTPIPGIPLVSDDDDLSTLITIAIEAAGLSLRERDILVIAQKIVSKAEGRQVDLCDIKPSERAKLLARETGKDPRLIELTLRESNEVIRHAKEVIIVEHKLGIIHANAGIDQSNLEGEDVALLLPQDPDNSAREIKAALEKAFGVSLGVIINDSTGRAWRQGTVGIAIGVAGVPALEDLRGQVDLTGRPLEITEVGTADQIAAAASLVQGQAGEGTPAVIISGLALKSGDGSAKDLLRPKSQDLFR